MMSNYHHLSPEGNDKTNYAPPTEILLCGLHLLEGLLLVSLACFSFQAISRPFDSSSAKRINGEWKIELPSSFLHAVMIRYLLLSTVVWRKLIHVIRLRSFCKILMTHIPTALNSITLVFQVASTPLLSLHEAQPWPCSKVYLGPE